MYALPTFHQLFNSKNFSPTFYINNKTKSVQAGAKRPRTRLQLWLNCSAAPSGVFYVVEIQSVYLAFPPARVTPARRPSGLPNPSRRRVPPLALQPRRGRSVPPATRAPAVKAAAGSSSPPSGGYGGRGRPGGRSFSRRRLWRRRQVGPPDPVPPWTDLGVARLGRAAVRGGGGGC